MSFISYFIPDQKEMVEPRFPFHEYFVGSVLFVKVDHMSIFQLYYERFRDYNIVKV